MSLLIHLLDRSPHLSKLGAGSLFCFLPIVSGLTCVGWDGAYSLDFSPPKDPGTPLEDFAVGMGQQTTTDDDPAVGWQVVCSSGATLILTVAGTYDTSAAWVFRYDVSSNLTTAPAIPAGHAFGSYVFDLEIPMDNTSIPAFWDHIGPAIKVIRVQRGIRQEDLAQALGKMIGEAITQSYISRIESGRERGGTGMSWKRLGLFCDLLDCKASQLIAVAEDLADETDTAAVFNAVDKLISDRLGDDTQAENQNDAAGKISQVRHQVAPSRNGKTLGK